MISKKFKINPTLLITTATLLFMSTVSVSEAYSVVRSGEVVSIEDNQTVEGDFYSLATTLNLSGQMEEDVVAMAGDINLNGPVGKNAFLFGGGINVNAEIGDDLRMIVIGKATVADDVRGDLFVLGGTVNILSTATVYGDVLLYTGEAVVHGNVKGDIIGSVGNLVVDGIVEGNIDLRITDMALTDNAQIIGNVTYSSSKELSQALNASIGGDLIRNDPVLPQKHNYPWPWVGPSLLILFSCLIWYLVSPTSINIMMEHAMVKSPRPLILGISTLIILPIFCALMFISTIGILVGLSLLLFYIFVITLSFTASVLFIGQLVTNTFNKSKSGASIITILVGIVCFGILSMLPVVGYAIFALAMVWILGTIIDIVIKFGVTKRDLLF